MPTPLRLPLSPRQAAALSTYLDMARTSPYVDGLTYEHLAALREIADKLDAVRGQD